jgi:hypothetical protein
MKTHKEIKQALSEQKAPVIYSLVDCKKYAESLVVKFNSKELAIFHIEEMILFLGIDSGSDVYMLLESLVYLQNQEIK